MLVAIKDINGVTTPIYIHNALLNIPTYKPIFLFSPSNHTDIKVVTTAKNCITFIIVISVL